MENLGPSAIYLQIAEVREGLKTQQNQLSELHHKIIDLQSKIASFEESLSVSDSVERIGKLEEVTEGLMKSYDNVSGRLDAHEKMFKDVERASNYLHEKASNTDTRVRRLDERSSNIEAKVKHLERRMDDKRERLNVHGTKIRAMERRMNESSLKLNGIDTKVRELERRGEEIRDKVMDWVRYLNRSVHDLLKHYLPSHQRRPREGILDF